MGRRNTIAALAVGLLLAASSGCVVGTGELGPQAAPAPEAECGDGDLVVAEACDDVFCGPPEVILGSGGAEFEDIDDKDVLDLYFGSQGGYHTFLSVQTRGLCPILWLEPRLEVDVDGELHTLYSEDLHVLTVRPEEGSDLQNYPGMRVHVPCAYWPEDPERDASCGENQSRMGHIDQMRVKVSITAEDHDNRAATDERWVDLDCCED